MLLDPMLNTYVMISLSRVSTWASRLVVHDRFVIDGYRLKGSERISEFADSCEADGEKRYASLSISASLENVGGCLLPGAARVAR